MASAVPPITIETVVAQHQSLFAVDKLIKTVGYSAGTQHTPRTAAHTAHRSTHRAPVHRESQREWRAEHRGKSTEQSTRTEYEDGQQIARRAERCCLALSARAAVYAAVAGFLAEILVRRRGATHQSVIGLNQIAAKCSETRYALRFHGSMGVLAEVDAISRPKLGEWNDQSLKTIDVVKSLTLIQYYAVSLALWYHCMH